MLVFHHGPTVYFVRIAFNQSLKRVPPSSWYGAFVPLHGIIAQLAFLFATAKRDHSLDVTSKYSTGNFKIITILGNFHFIDVRYFLPKITLQDYKARPDVTSQASTKHRKK